MSSLNVNRSPAGWRAHLDPMTTIADITRALEEFPQLVIDVPLESLTVTFILDEGGDEPDTQALAACLYGEDETLLVSEDTGAFDRVAEAFDQEAKERHAEGV